ncbi:hypothetical protein NKH18_12630 [Streptomyces sp. M10(2022)]
MSTRQRVFVRIAITFVLLITLGGGLGLAAEGLEGRTALRDGPVGALTPPTASAARSPATGSARSPAPTAPPPSGTSS